MLSPESGALVQSYTKDGVHSESALANALYSYEVRVKGVDNIVTLEAEPRQGTY